MQHSNIIAADIQSDNDNEEIIENDDYYDDPSVYDNPEEKELLLFDNESLQFDVIEEHFNNKDKEIDYMYDIDIELPYDTMFMPIKKILSDQDENKYVKQIECLLAEKQSLKEINMKLTEEKRQIEVQKTKMKRNKSTDLRIKDNEAFEGKKIEIESLLEQKKNEEKMLIENNNELQSNIDNYLKEFNQIRNEMAKKSNVILENQKKLLQLEKEMAESGAKSSYLSNQKLKKTDMINQIKYRTTSVMTQLTKANVQISKLMIENDTLKQRLKPFEEEVSTVNNHKYTYTNPTIMNEDNKNTENTITISEQIKSKPKTPTSKVQPFITTTMNVFPCQKEMVKKERMILEIESSLYKLQKERDVLNNNLSKLPEFPKHKDQINQKRQLELSITEFNTKINLEKQKLRELNKVS